MSKSHQIIRILLLALLPFILGLVPYLAFTHCIKVEPSPPWGKTALCGWPLVDENIYVQPYSYGPYGEIDYLGLSADVAFWLLSAAAWTMLLRCLGPPQKSSNLTEVS
jgi:hypothetical protein